MSELALTDNGKIIDLRRDDPIVLRLPEDPDTGYRWAVVALDDDVLTVESSAFSQGIGGGGMRTLLLSPKRAGTAHLQLKHWREWEGDRSSLDRFEVTLRIRD